MLHREKCCAVKIFKIVISNATEKLKKKLTEYNLNERLALRREKKR